MRFSLYIPNQQLLDKWQMAADRKGMSLALYIRLAVDEKIKRDKRKVK